MVWPLIHKQTDFSVKASGKLTDSQKTPFYCLCVSRKPGFLGLICLLCATFVYVTLSSKQQRKGAREFQAPTQAVFSSSSWRTLRDIRVHPSPTDFAQMDVPRTPLKDVAQEVSWSNAGTASIDSLAWGSTPRPHPHPDRATHCFPAKNHGLWWSSSQLLDTQPRTFPVHEEGHWPKRSTEPDHLRKAEQSWGPQGSLAESRDVVYDYRKQDRITCMTKYWEHTAVTAFIQGRISP